MSSFCTLGHRASGTTEAEQAQIRAAAAPVSHTAVLSVIDREDNHCPCGQPRKVLLALSGEQGLDAGCTRRGVISSTSSDHICTVSQLLAETLRTTVTADRTADIRMPLT